jgi:hypothetical protein
MNSSFSEKKTGNHLKKWQEQHEFHANELNECLDWMGIDEETFLKRKKSEKRVTATKAISGEEKKRKVEK